MQFIGRLWVVAAFLMPLVRANSGAAQERVRDAVAKTVVTVGTGPTFWDARTQAVRQAVQQALPQLVIADRVVDQNVVLKDALMSTMNGYVDQFEILRQEQDTNGWTVEARITVSPSLMDRFLGQTGAAGTASVDGMAMLADALAARERRGANTALMERILDGIPDQIYDVAVVGITAIPDDDAVVVTYSLAVNDAFLRQVRSAFTALSEAGVARRKQFEAIDRLVPDTMYVWLGNSEVFAVGPVDPRWNLRFQSFADDLGRNSRADPSGSRGSDVSRSGLSEPPRVPVVVRAGDNAYYGGGVDYRGLDKDESAACRPAIIDRIPWQGFFPGLKSYGMPGVLLALYGGAWQCTVRLPTMFFEGAMDVRIEVASEAWRSQDVGRASWSWLKEPESMSLRVGGDEWLGVTRTAWGMIYTRR